MAELRPAVMPSADSRAKDTFLQRRRLQSCPQAPGKQPRCQSVRYSGSLSRLAACDLDYRWRVVQKTWLPILRKE